MANERGEVRLRLDRERVVCFTPNSLIDFKQATGQSFYKWLEGAGRLFVSMSGKLDDALKVLDEFPYEEVRAALWACLRRDDRNLTVEQVGDLIELAEGEGLLGKYGTCANAVVEAFAASQGKAAKKKLEEAMATLKSPTGTPSDA